jgi:signal transduction histidine kinase
VSAGGLPSSSLLAELPAPVLQALLDAGRQLELEPGQVLMREGDEPDGLYVVLEGALSVSKVIDGVETPLGTCGPGDPLGELSIVQGRPRLATVRATTQARVLCVAPDTFQDLLTAPHVALALLATVAQRLEVLELQLRQQGRMAMLGSLSAGLLHELNNPAAAVGRSVARLGEVLAAWQKVDADLDTALRHRLTALLDQAAAPDTPLARLDVEDELVAHLDALGIADAAEMAPHLAGAGIRAADLDATLLADGDAGPLRWLALRGRLLRLLAEAGAGAARISEVVAAMKRYAHVDEASVQDVDVHEGIESTLTLLTGRVPSGVEIVREYDPALPTVEGYPGDLNSVWTNLLDNALDAIGGAGTLTVRTAATAPGVRVEIENTGPAIPPEVLERAFDPFFSTKPVGEGTGLGLATSYAVVAQRHRGRLSLTSQPGRTVATVVLPTAGRDGAEAARIGADDA